MFEYGLVHMALITFSVCIFGYLYAIPGLVLIVIAIDKMIGYFGYTRLNHVELINSYEYKTKNYHISGYMEIDKINYEEFEETFIIRALTKIRKLRRILVFKLGIGLWKDIPISEAAHQIIKDDKELQSHQEIIDYCCELNNQPMDRARPLWEFRVIENYTDKTSLLIYRTHHCFMDGVGFASLMSTLNDDQFATQLNKSFVMPTAIEKAKYAITAPLNLKEMDSITGEWNTDEKAKKIEESKAGDHYTSKFYASKEYNFKDIRKCYKQYPKMTFNGFVFSILGKSFDQLFKHHGINDAKKLVTQFPVNMRPLPTSYENIIIDNFFTMSTVELPLMQDMNTIHETINPYFHKLIIDKFLYASYYLLKVVAYLPKVLSLMMVEAYVQKVDAAVSNIAFSDVPWKINGKEIKNITMNNAAVFHMSVGLIVYTYNKKVRFGMNIKKDMKMDSNKLMDILLSNIEEEIQKTCKTE